MNNASNPWTGAGAGGKQLSLLPEQPFSPQWPRRSTLPCETLERMLAGEKLTQPSFGLTRWRLSAYIKALEYLGWEIHRADVPNPHGKYPIREYWLDDETIRAASSLRGAQA